MSRESIVTEADGFFAGTDAKMVYEIFKQGAPLDSDGVPTQCEDVSAFAMKWSLRLATPVVPPYREQGTEVLTKATGSGITVTGTYNLTRSVNTQRVEVAIADTDTDALAGGNYVDALKRTDAGLESVLSYGTVKLLVAPAR